MANVKMIHNKSCLKCDCLEEHMVSVGDMIFCRECFQVEFQDLYDDETFEVNTYSTEYAYWKSKYKKMQEQLHKNS